MRQSENLPNRGGGNEKPSFLLRWRGKTEGPFSYNEIQRKLSRQEIGMLHEVFQEGRWIPINQLALPATKKYIEDRLGEISANLPQSSKAPAINENGRLSVRWKGRLLGELSLPEIESQLDRQEIGMLHEVYSGGEWTTLNNFFVRRNLSVAKTRISPELGTRKQPASGKTGLRISLENVGMSVKQGGKILQNINLGIEPNEFIGLLGPSGSGKSTLMNAITGRQRATTGSLQINGVDFYKNAFHFRNRIGHVPQKDIVHLPLTVLQELTFAAYLRLPSLNPDWFFSERVNQVIEQIGLSERKSTRNQVLSGGQLKRVSLGLELLSNPELLFLDEATSGLDAGTEARMMSLFRSLADGGRTVICITHNLENVCLCDLVVVLKEGYLVFYGPPNELANYFNVEKTAQIYEALELHSAEEWAGKYVESPFHKLYVVSRRASNQTNPQAAFSPPTTEAASNSALHQFTILTRRYFQVALQDRKNIMLLLAQAPVIAILLGLVFAKENFNDQGNGPINQKMLSFLLVISAIWFGCINAAREIVKELPLYLRERAIGLNLASYFASKFAVLSIFCLIQCFALISITFAMTHFRPDFLIQITCLLLTSFVGMWMGLLVSSLVKNEDKAIAIVPILLIPQVIFSGAILKLSGLSELIAKWIVVSFWSLDAMLHSLGTKAQDVVRPGSSLGEDLLTIGTFLALLMILSSIILKQKDPL